LQLVRMNSTLRDDYGSPKLPVEVESICGKVSWMLFSSQRMVWAWIEMTESAYWIWYAVHFYVMEREWKVEA